MIIMSKPEQILQIDPPTELTFVGPFTTAVSSTMTLRNPSERKVCFKIKTTAPKRYCVKPNSGVIDPKQTVQIAVSLQPFEYEPQEKNRHKFMVQAMYAPDGEINQDTLWKETDGSQMMDSKLKCVFVMPEDSSNSQTSNGAPTNDYDKPSYHNSVSTSAPAPTKPITSSSSPKVSYSDTGDVNLRKSVEEIKKLQEEVSSLRQENLQLKEEALRQKRLASSRSGLGNEPSSSSLLHSGGASEAFSVQATSPDATALSTTYIYAALVVLVVGIIIGKWIF
jgi:hypothetical protein